MDETDPKIAGEMDRRLAELEQKLQSFLGEINDQEPTADAWWLNPTGEQGDVPKPTELPADQIRAVFSEKASQPRGRKKPK